MPPGEFRMVHYKPLASTLHSWRYGGVDDRAAPILLEMTVFAWPNLSHAPELSPRPIGALSCEIQF